jgi:hypothetical protein
MFYPGAMPDRKFFVRTRIVACFLTLLGELTERYDIEVHAYMLMGNPISC